MEFFKLHFEGGFQSTAYYDSQNQLKFEPPVYEQRYATALRVLSFWEGSFKKIIDFGCAELKFIHMLKQIPEIEHIIGKRIEFNFYINKKSSYGPPDELIIKIS